MNASGAGWVSENRTYLLTWIDAGSMVHWQVWDGDPDVNGSLAFTGAYQLTGTYATNFGAAQAGYPGFFWDNPATQSLPAGTPLLGNKPSIWMLQIKENTPGYAWNGVSLIGPHDVEPKLVIWDRVVNPRLQIINSEGLMGSASFRGVFIDYNAAYGAPAVAFRNQTPRVINTPVSIDIATGEIIDGQGNNIFGALNIGSTFVPLTPGFNAVQLTADYWLPTSNEHAQVVWRDTAS